MAMESVMNRLRNTVVTVTSTVSSLSVVLPGNPVTRDFELTEHIASAGPDLHWKIFSAVKKSTKQEASVFLFEKKSIDKLDKRDREALIEALKRGVQQLTKLKHPRFLTIQHPLEESRDSLAFATEPVFASLANVFGNLDNFPSNLAGKINKYELSEMEIKYGVLQVADGLGFLHNDARLLHGNLCPESILINNQGAWKIGGLDFSLPLGTTGSVEIREEFQNYDFAAPEMSKGKAVAASDLLSLGLITYAGFNGGKSLLPCGGAAQSSRLNVSKLKNLSYNSLSSIPTDMRDLTKRLLAFEPEARPFPHEFTQLEADEGVKTLRYLDSLFQWDNLQKSKFYKQLPDLLPRLPHRLKVQRLVSTLAQEFVNPPMVPFVLPSVLKISEEANEEEYITHILPHIRQAVKLREPVQVLLVLMQSMDLLLQKTPADITKSDLLPLIYGALESDSAGVIERTLVIIPTIAPLIDFANMKNSLLPRLKKVTLHTQHLSVRVSALLCLARILDGLDRWLVIDFLLPLLAEVPARDPAVIMAILGIYKVAVGHGKIGLSADQIATRILPALCPLSVESGLSPSQFSQIISFIRELVNKIESEQGVRLQEISSNNSNAPWSDTPIKPMTKVSPPTPISSSFVSPTTPSQPFQPPQMISRSGVGTAMGGISIAPSPISYQPTFRMSAPIPPNLTTPSGGPMKLTNSGTKILSKSEIDDFLNFN